jgi:serine/threonine protein kinase
MREQHGFISEFKRSNTDAVSDLHSFSNYDLVELIAVGGMGEVYLARQRTAFGRAVAVKIIRSDLVNDPAARQRFLREAEMGSYLKHDHILPLLEFGEEQGRLFIVTPYIEGGTLAQRLDRGPLSLTEVHALFSALVRAVSYLHKRGIVHRDLKPGNILLDKEEDSDRIYVRLIDFGIATAQGLPIGAPLTSPDSDSEYELGTIAYMAPERLDGVAAPSNDIFSLGIILHVMLTGELPAPGGFHGLPAPLTSVIRRCIAVNPDERFATADDLSQSFEQAYMSLTSPGLPAIRRSVQPETPQSHPPLTNEPQATLVQPLSPSPSQLQEPASRPPKSASREYPVVPRLASPSLLSNPPQESTILPPLPNQRSKFSKLDYDAPTTEIDTDSKKKRFLSVGTMANAQQTQLPKQRVPRRPGRRGISIFLLICILIVLLVGLMGGIGYVVFQSSIIATVTVEPRVQTVSSVFTLTAQPGLKASNASLSEIPANVFTSTAKGSLQGTTSGVTGCTLAIFDCKPAVTLNDISSLSAQLMPGLKTQIQQDLSKQAAAAGATTVGDIFYSSGDISPNPPLGTSSKTVTVTVTEQGSIEYFKAKDAQNLAVQMLQRKLGSNYTFIDSSTRVGTPVVRSVGNNGAIKIAIAAAGVARYQIPSTALSDIKNHVKGQSLKTAQTFISQYPGLNSTDSSIRISYGTTVPTNIQQIKLVQLNPINIPAVQLPAVPRTGT